MHKLLQRQLRRAFGEKAPDAQGMDRFIEAVDAAYTAADDDRQMLERALDITSQLMLEKNQELEAAIESTERAKESAEQASSEKGLLLREIHHRVKNNLQIIVSLLNLQAGSRDDEEFRSDISEVTDRIMSMAVVHELLYESGDFSSLDFAAYLERIAAGAARTAGPACELKLDLRPVRVSLDKAVPCALIVSEALTNAIKHGKGPDGRSSIRLRLCEWDHHVEIEVADSGPGFTPGIHELERHGIGVTLMTALAEQVQGRISFGNSGGAFVRLEMGR